MYFILVSSDIESGIKIKMNKNIQDVFSIFLNILMFTFFPKIDKGDLFRDANIIYFNDKGDILLPSEEIPKDGEWQFIEAIFQVEIPAVNFAGGFVPEEERFHTHTIDVVFWETRDRTAFRENYFWKGEYRKTEKIFQERVIEFAGEQMWVWDTESESTNAPAQIQCHMIH